MTMRIDKETNSSTETKTMDKKSKNTIMHKDNRAISTSQAKTKSKKVTELGIKKDKDNRKKREAQKSRLEISKES